MVGRRLRVVQPLRPLTLVAVLATAVVIGGCAAFSSRPSLPVDPAGVVQIGPDAAAARINDGRVEVIVATPGVADEAGAVSTITSSNAPRGANSVFLLSYGGATSDEYNTFVYGTAAPGVSRVDLGWPSSAGGNVVDGAWLVALHEKDVAPDQIHWRFLGADGQPTSEGSGLLNPGS